VIDIVLATDIPALADVRVLIQAHISAHSAAHNPASTAALIAALPAPYCPPRGGLWVAYQDGEAAGCVALHALGSSVAEIKRMYVQPEHRGCGAGRVLLRHVIEEARRRNYLTLRLGTLATMHAAQALYTSAGFRQIEAYRAVEFGDTVFYELPLLVAPSESLDSTGSTEHPPVGDDPRLTS
jgi:GNAT superfamily N-acetyltransferase